MGGPVRHEATLADIRRLSLASLVLGATMARNEVLRRDGMQIGDLAATPDLNETARRRCTPAANTPACAAGARER
jgi:hypothetical protein